VKLRFLVYSTLFLVGFSDPTLAASKVCTPKELAAIFEQYLHPSPGLKEDPYSPAEVEKRQEIFQREFSDPIRITEFLEFGNKNNYQIWLDSLDPNTRRRVEASVTRVKAGNLGKPKPVGEGVFEIRLFFDSGLRIYFAGNPKSGLVFLTGGSKRTQVKDILKAKKLNAEIPKH